MLKLKWNSDIFWITLFLVLSTLFFTKRCYFDRNEYRRLIASTNRVVGTVHNIGISGDYRCYYEVNGKEYNYRRSKPYDEIITGEKFMVAYEPGDPETAYALFFEPFIQADSIFENTATTYIKDISLHSSFEFKYKVNEKEYTRFSIPRPNQEVDENSRYLVKYKKSNPRMGYIFLDSLVKN